MSSYRVATTWDGNADTQNYHAQQDSNPIADKKHQAFSEKDSYMGETGEDATKDQDTSLDGNSSTDEEEEEQMSQQLPEY